MSEKESIKLFAEEYANKAKLVKELLKPMPPIKIPQDPQVELTRKLNKLTEEANKDRQALIDKSDAPDKRAKRAEFIAIAALILAVLQYFKG